MTGFDVAQVYMALKAHYSSGSYDFFKYNGRVKWLNPDRFEHHKDKWQFHKLSKLYPDREACTFFIASNFFESGDVWIRTLFTEDAKNIYLEKLRIKESLEYLVMQDVEKIRTGMLLTSEQKLSRIPEFKDYLTVKDGQNPALLNLAYHNELPKETIVALNAAIGFLPVWEKKIADSIIFPSFKHRCLAYEPFLKINVKSLREKLRMELTNT